MAERGKPLPFAVRQQIKQERNTSTIRSVASKLHVSVNTVQKYAKKFDTKALNEKE